MLEQKMKETSTAPSMLSGGRPKPMPKPSFGDKFRRVLWALVASTLFRYSPVPMHGVRALLLRIFGARIQGKVYVYPSTSIRSPWNLEMGPESCLGPRVICYNVGNVILGSCALVSQGAHLCGASHDFRVEGFPLLVGEIRIGANAWVAADAFVGPGVQIGEGAVVGACSVVMRDVPCEAVFAGNPARQVGTRWNRDLE